MKTTGLEIRTMRFFLAGLLFASSCAWSASGEPPGKRHVWKSGAEIYEKICAYCHEERVGPRIRKRGLPPQYIQMTVRSGRGAMPAFRAAEIDDDSLAMLAEYISKNP